MNELPKAEVLKLKDYFSTQHDLSEISTNNAYENIRKDLGLTISVPRMRYLKKSFLSGCILADGTVKRVPNSRTLSVKITKGSDKTVSNSDDVIPKLERENKRLLEAIKQLPNSGDVIKGVLQEQIDEIDVHVKEYRAKLIAELYGRYDLEPPE